MKSYDLDVSRLVRVVPFLGLAVFTVGMPLTLLRDLGENAIVFLPLGGILCWQWWVLLTLAYRVVVHEDGSLEWVALARRVRMLPEDIKQIAPDSMGSIGFFAVAHTGGKVRFLNQITGFHEVLIHVKARNPQAVLRGC